ncbi:hypothetical protein ACFOEY_06530 [Paracandidimonas soli]|uniref:hypothetical protein n=1 Tax=Paracandidimonas soli TaxID=1917182 RepID=UPI00361DFF9C
MYSRRHKPRAGVQNAGAGGKTSGAGNSHAAGQLLAPTIPFSRLSQSTLLLGHLCKLCALLLELLIGSADVASQLPFAAAKVARGYSGGVEAIA